MHFLSPIPLLGFWLFFSTLSAQQLDTSKVNEAMEWHDQGRYADALNRYNSLLLEFPESSLLHYEKSLTCAAMNDYPCCIASGNQVLQIKNGPYHAEAYLSVSSCLDYSGKPQESIDLLKKALRKEGANYLFYFNLGVTYARMEEVEKSMDYLKKGILTNSAHPSGHFVLALQELQSNNQVKAFMAFQYFLLLEPTGARAKQGAEALWALFQNNAPIPPKRENEGENITILIQDNLFPDQEFPDVGTYINLSVGLLQALDKKDPTAEEQFVKVSETIYTFLGEKASKSKKDPFYSLYLPFFSQLLEAGHMEVFSYYILQSANKNAASWLSRNPEKLEAFSLWAASL